MRVFETHRSILSLAFTPNGRGLATAGWQHVSVWDLVHGFKEHPVAQTPPDGYCLGARFSPAGTYLSWLAQRPDGGPLELRLASTRPLRQLPDKVFRRAAGKAWKYGSAPAGFLKDDLLVAADQSAIFPVGHPAPVPYIRWGGPDGGADQLAVRPGAAEVIVGDPVGLKYLRTADWAPVGKVDLPSPPVQVAMAPDGRSAAVTVAGRLVVIGPARGGVMFEDDGIKYRAAAFAPDGRRLIAVGNDRTAVVFDTELGKELVRFDWPAGGAEAVAVSPDGLTAAMAGFTGEVVVWDLAG